MYKIRKQVDESKLKPLTLPLHRNIHYERFDEFPSSVSSIHTHAYSLFLSFHWYFKEVFRTYLNIHLWFPISCVRANSYNSILLFFPSWIQIDTEHGAETPKTCQVWILVLTSPPGHISEINFEASDSMFQNSSRVFLFFLKDQLLTNTVNIYWTSAIHIRHCAKWLTYILLLDLNSLQVNILLFPFHRWGNWGLGKCYGPTLHS